MVRVNRRQRLNYFTYYGWTIPVFFVVFWVSFFFIFQQIYAAKRYQKLVLFYAAYNLKDDSIHKDMKKGLEQYNCLEVDYYSYSLNDVKIANYYYSLKANCDFFIMSESDLSEMQEYIDREYMPLSEDIINTSEVPSSYEYYSFGDTKYGFKVFDKDNEEYSKKTGFYKWINFSSEDKTDNFYLVINKDSVNFNQKDNHILGYKGLKWLLDETSR